MAKSGLDKVVRHICGVSAEEHWRSQADGALLRAFVERGDQDAFAVLVKRYGPLILATCRRVLRQLEDAEDAFQATFIVLARQARALVKNECVGGWLHRVAHRLALDARRALERRSRHERQSTVMNPTNPEWETGWREVQVLLDDETQRLSERYRDVFVLCALGGQSCVTAAQRLGLKEGTVRSRLAEARKRLQARLSRRGVELPAVLGAAALSQSGATGQVAPGLVAKAVAAATSATVPASVTALVKGLTVSLAIKKAKVGMALFLFLGATVGTTTMWAVQEDEKEKAPRAQAAGKQEAVKAEPAVVKDLYGDPLPESAIARLGTIRFRHGGRAIHSLLLTRDGKTLVSSTYDGDDRTVHAWDVITGKLRHDFPGRLDDLTATALSPDGMTLATGDERVIHFWDLESGRQRHELRVPVRWVEGLAYSADGKMLASGHSGGTVLLWDLATGTNVGRLPARHNRLTFLQFTPDGKTLVTGGGLDRTVRVFDVASRTERHQITRPNDVRGVALAPNGGLLALGASNGSASIWDVGTGQLVRELRGAPWVTGLAFSPDGSVLASAEFDEKTDLSSIAIWDSATGTELRRLKKVGRPWCLAFDLDGKTVIAGGGGAIRLWDAITGEERGPAPGNPEYIGSIAVAAASRIMAYSADSDARLWDLAARKEVGRLAGNLNGYGHRWSIALSLDGNALAGGSGLTKVNLWDQPFEGHIQSCACI